MNKSSIRKLMATSVLTAFIAMSNIQLVSAASKYPVNLSKITTNCAQTQSNYGIKVIKTYKGNTDCKNTKNNTNNNVNTVSQSKPTSSNTNNTADTTSQSKPTSSNTNNTANTTSQSKPTTTATKPSATKPDSSVAALEKEVVTLVNAERAKAGLPALKANAELSNVARLKSQDMIDKNYFSHTSPTYGSPFDMMKKFGIKYSAAGENIASGYPTAKAVVDGWMNSPGHRANILSKSFTEIGVGLAKSSNGTSYWTQMFINPGK
ncbi:CAP domain-containing protein [Clostridium sporogenes]|jgi:uncharacterized YkwD family protein|uniref:Serine protease n=2 Tax=Clostridium TaxID=1485 RepID=A0A0D1BUE1_CLOBO|nr:MULTISPECIES: CAP domain-containing protein [Clostridium]MBE6075790.1 serine protease [Clostridium lundense]MDU2831466.1 CAP domain-containing protein [Clostridium botulinum]EDU36798.1 SCP-like protein [Clostridium sporogenes ATCC 15579]KIS23950.1 serine protease [Clostridium botulinum B2 450]MCW6093197.1 CAP domain-containing protein [Clostridium sporogenes]